MRASKTFRPSLPWPMRASFIMRKPSTIRPAFCASSSGIGAARSKAFSAALAIAFRSPRATLRRRAPAFRGASEAGRETRPRSFRRRRGAHRRTGPSRCRAWRRRRTERGAKPCAAVRRPRRRRLRGARQGRRAPPAPSPFAARCSGCSAERKATASILFIAQPAAVKRASAPPARRACLRPRACAMTPAGSRRPSGRSPLPRPSRDSRSAPTSA